MKIFRKQIDERQDLELMRIERSGFYVILFALAASILIQAFFFDISLQHIAGESIAILLGACIVMFGYIRRGLWDHFSKPGIKSYLLYSIPVAIIYGLMPLRTHQELPIPELLQLLSFRTLSSFTIMFLLLSLTGKIIKMRAKKLQEDYSDKEDKK